MGARKIRLVQIDRVLNGAQTIHEARQKAQDFTYYLDRLAARGWVLDGPVRDGCLYVKKKKEVQDGYEGTPGHGPDAAGAVFQ